MIAGSLLYSKMRLRSATKSLDKSAENEASPRRSPRTFHRDLKRVSKGRVRKTRVKKRDDTSEYTYEPWLSPPPKNDQSNGSTPIYMGSWSPSSSPSRSPERSPSGSPPRHVKQPEEDAGREEEETGDAGFDEWANKMWYAFQHGHRDPDSSRQVQRICCVINMGNTILQDPKGSKLVLKRFCNLKKYVKSGCVVMLLKTKLI